MQDKKRKVWRIVIISLILLVIAVIIFPFIKPIRVTWSSLPYVYTIYGTHVEINKYTGNEGEVVIPDTICFRPVTVLRTTDGLGGIETYGNECVFSDSKVTSVYIPDTVESIGEFCFLRCENLMEVRLPDGLHEIGEGTFTKCSVLKAIEIPSGVKIIGEGAFLDCIDLKAIVIPEGVEIIEGSAFRRCSDLEHVVLPQSLTKLEGSVFEDCEQLLSIEIPEGVEKIEGDSFKGTAWEATWGADFMIVGKNVLLHYAGNEKIVEIPEGVEYIGSWVLEECTNAEHLILPESVKECDNYIISSNNLKYIVVNNPDMLFSDWETIDARDSNIPAPTIVAEKGSTAEAYARENGYPFLESIPEE